MVLPSLGSVFPLGLSGQPPRFARFLA
jgi:hypothetical protein